MKKILNDNSKTGGLLIMSVCIFECFQNIEIQKYTLFFSEDRDSAETKQAK